MKRLLFATVILAGLLVSSKSEAQVRVHANIGIGVPVYSAPPVVYEPAYPVYDRGYDRRVVVVDRRRGRWEQERCYRDRYQHRGRGYYKRFDRDDRYRDYDRRGYDHDDRRY
jgi:hypothetical protein